MVVKDERVCMEHLVDSTCTSDTLQLRLYCVIAQINNMHTLLAARHSLTQSGKGDESR